MNIRNQNFPPGITLDATKAFPGASDDIEEILLTEAGNGDDVIAVVKVGAGRAGAIAGYVDGRFRNERRLSARVMTLLNE